MDQHVNTPGLAVDRLRPHPLLGRDVLYRIQDDYNGDPQYRSAKVVRVWSDTCVNLLVYPDGTNDGQAMPGIMPSYALPQVLAGPMYGGIWKTSASRGDGMGQWLLPEDFYPMEAVELQSCQVCCGNMVTAQGEKTALEAMAHNGAAATFDPTKTVMLSAEENLCNTAIKLSCNDQGQVESAEVVKLQEAAPATTASCSPRTVGDTAVDGGAVSGAGGNVSGGLKKNG